MHRHYFSSPIPYSNSNERKITLTDPVQPTGFSLKLDSKKWKPTAAQTDATHPLTFLPRPPGAPLQPGRVHLGDTAAVADSLPRPTGPSAFPDPRRPCHLPLPLDRRLFLHLGHEQARHLALHRTPAAHGLTGPLPPPSPCPAPRPAGSAPAPRCAMGDVVRRRLAGASWLSWAASRVGRSAGTRGSR